MIFRIVVSFSLTPFLLLHMGKETYGVWALALSFSLSGLLSLFSFGFQGALIKYVAEYTASARHRDLSEVISVTLFIYTFMGVIASLFIYIFSSFYLQSFFTIPPELLGTTQTLLILFAVQVLFELPGYTLDAIIAGLQRFDIIAALEAGKTGLFALLAVYALRSGYGVIGVGSSMVGVTFIHVAVMAVYSKRLLPQMRLVKTFNRKVMTDMIDFTKDLFILRINGIIYNNMDKIIIGALLSSTFVTDYDIANRIHSMALMAAGLAPSVVIPAASAFNAVDEKERLKILLLKGTKYTLAMSLPVIAALFVLAKPLISYWISPIYEGTAIYARLFLSYLFFWTAVQLGWNMLVGVKEVKPIVRIQIFSVALNLVLTYFLVKKVGVAGAMLGTIIGNAAAFFPYLRLMLKRFDVSGKFFLRTVVLAVYPQVAASGGVLFLMTIVRYPRSLLEVGAYAFSSLIVFYVIFYFTGVDSDEKKRFLSLAKGWVAKTA